MPAYNDTPLATNPINQTQAPIRTNFQSIEALIDVNHVDFSDPINYGKHNLVSLVSQTASPPASGFAATDVGFYNFLYPITNSNEVYVNKLNLVSSVLTPVQIPMTASFLSTTTLPIALPSGAGGRAGWTYLPSGILMKWGPTGPIAAGATPTPVLFPVAANIPVFNNVFNVQVTTGGSNTTGTILTSGGVIGATGAPTGFNVWSVGGAGVGGFYLAIGN